MKYQQVIITILPYTQERSEVIMALLSDIAYESFSEEEGSLSAYIPLEHFDEDALVNVLADVVAAEEEVDLQLDYEFREMPDENWNAVWESNFEPVRIDSRLLIRAPFHETDPKVEFEIVMEPRMSFGTGHHATTWLMSEAILNHPPLGKSILDMGCGTGVLAILALMNGATEAVAIDIDPWCYESSVENAERNGVKDKMLVMQGDAGLLKGRTPFGVIYANINRNILLNDMEAYVGVLDAGGEIYFSGIYTEDIPMIDACARKLGLELCGQSERNNWACLRYQRK